MALPPEIADPRIWSFWVGVTIQAAVALIVLFLAPHDWRHRTFALLVGSNAAWDLADGFVVVRPENAANDTQASLHFAMWTVGALAAFLASYPRPRAWTRRALWGILAATLAYEAVYFARPDLMDVRAGVAYGAVGPLTLFLVGWFPLLVAAAAWLIHTHRRRGDLAPLVVAMAFLVYPLRRTLAIDVSLLAEVAGPGALTLYATAGAVFLAPLVAVYGVVVLLRSGAKRAAVVLGALLAIVTAVPLIPTLDERFPGAHAILFGLVTAYALAHGRLFDIDLKIKWTISRGSVAAVFLGVFLVASQVAQNWLQGYGVIVGGVAAGALLFVVHPLQRAAERFAERAMPGVRDTPEYVGARKRDVYRAALEGAMSDGEVTAKERDILTRLQLELGIANVEARAMEAEMGRAA